MAVTQIIEDMGIADLFTVRAGVAISGGMWAVPTSGSWSAALASTGTVAVYGANAVTITSVQASGITVPIGLALQDTASGTSSYVSVLRQGTVILLANGAVTAGYPVAASNAGAATAMIANQAATVNGSVAPVGLSYTACGSNEYAIVRLQL